MSVVNAGLEKLLKPTKTDVLIDLGCGDGRWLIAAAKKYGCRCIDVVSRKNDWLLDVSK